MSDAIPFPPRPHVDHYKKRAKDLVKACKSGDAEAVRVWLATWLEAVAALQSLTMTAELREEINRYAEQLDARWRKVAKTAGRAPKCTLANAQFVLKQAAPIREQLLLVPCRLAILRSFTVEPVVPILRALALFHRKAAVGHDVHDRPGLAIVDKARETDAEVELRVRPGLLLP